MEVSILVLVEGILQSLEEVPDDCEIRCFNPCFSGRYSAIFSRPTLKSPVPVSILVLVEGILQLYCWS